MGSELWTILLDLVLVMAAAALLGAGFERLGQSAVLGYLAAGLALGPGGLHVISRADVVAAAAELGVVLLLFAIGIEFSWGRLRSIGSVAGAGGSLQVALTGVVAAAATMAVGQPWRAATAVGAMIALSSTATVLRILTDRGELDSVQGRTTVGILLFQDLALVPLVLLVTLLGRGGSASQAIAAVGRTVALGAGLVLVFVYLSRHVLPRALRAVSGAAGRELQILVAVATLGGAAWSAHALGLSPALGAFVAGVLLGESPYATQIRADVGGLKTLFVTVFFVAIGMVAEPRWAAAHPLATLAVVAAVLVGKAVVAAGVARLLGVPASHAVRVGVNLAQVGEFSFVLAGIAGGAGLISPGTHALVVTSTVATLFLTPFLVALGPAVGGLVAGHQAGGGGALADPGRSRPGPAARRAVVIGYGPAGQRVAAALASLGVASVIVDLNPRTVAAARRSGREALVGDAGVAEVLEAAGVGSACAVVISVPDYRGALAIARQTRALAPAVPVLVRARHHVTVPEFAALGVEAVVDEEELVGERLGTLVGALSSPAPTESART